MEILHEIDRRDSLIFPWKPWRQMEPRHLRILLGSGATAHGLRSAFRDWAGEETSFPREIAEEALAHATGNVVERAYRRGDALERRRELMTLWARFCEPGAKGNVVPIRGAS
jgi:integrase